MPQLDIASFANQIIWLTVIFVTLITIFRTVISTTYNKLAHYKKHLKKVFNLAKWNEVTTTHLKKSWSKKVSKAISKFQITDKMIFPTKSYSPEKLATQKAYTNWVAETLVVGKRWSELQTFCKWFTYALKK